jgi:hypothetical protein
MRDECGRLPRRSFRGGGTTAPADPHRSGRTGFRRVVVAPVRQLRTPPRAALELHLLRSWRRQGRSWRWTAHPPASLRMVRPDDRRGARARPTACGGGGAGLDQPSQWCSAVRLETISATMLNDDAGPSPPDLAKGSPHGSSGGRRLGVAPRRGGAAARPPCSTDQRSSSDAPWVTGQPPPSRAGGGLCNRRMPRRAGHADASMPP